VGLIFVVALLLLILGRVAVRPRIPQVLHGTMGTLALMIGIVLALVMSGAMQRDWLSV
jgi:hypothetical protein